MVFTDFLLLRDILNIYGQCLSLLQSNVGEKKNKVMWGEQWLRISTIVETGRQDHGSSLYYQLLLCILDIFHKIKLKNIC